MPYKEVGRGGYGGVSREAGCQTGEEVVPLDSALIGQHFIAWYCFVPSAVSSSLMDIKPMFLPPGRNNTERGGSGQLLSTSLEVKGNGPA